VIGVYVLMLCAAVGGGILGWLIADAVKKAWRHRR